MKRKLLLILFVPVLFLTTHSCRKDKIRTPTPSDTAVYNPTPYTIADKPYYPKIELNSDNPLTVEGILLGRMLYYDKTVHPAGVESCSSCHQQANAFTSNVYFNSFHILPHENLAWNKYFLWNGDIQGKLEDITQFEVNDFFNCNPDNLKNIHNYPYYFFKAFGSYEITNKKIAYALAQFLRTIISDNSKFDKWMGGQATLSASEERGMNIFYSEQGDCFHCHNLMLFTDLSFHNNGLDTVYEGVNLGRFSVTGDSSDLGKFKTPTLRNIELRAPYMHDGRYSTLEEVIDFYAKPTHPSSTIDPIMTKPNHLAGLSLSPQDKQDIISFLKCLTDTSFTHNKAFGSPF